MIIDDNYNSDDFSFGYYQNLFNQELSDFDLNEKIPINRSQIKQKIKNWLNKEDLSSYAKSLGEALNLANINAASEEGIKKSFKISGRKENELITKEDINLIYRMVAEELLDRGMIGNKKKKNNDN